MGTQKDKSSTELVLPCTSREADGQANPSVERLVCDVEEDSEATDFTLPRKAAGEIQGARTANRHR